MIDNVTSLDDIYCECTKIQAVLEITISEQPDEAVQHGNDLAVYIARTGKMVADSKYHLNFKMNSTVISIIKRTALETGTTAKAINALVDSACAREQYLVDWCDRLNRTATHQLEWCRTVISKAKAEMMSVRGI